MKKMLTVITLMAVYQMSFAACDQTVGPGANLASIVSNAPNGSIICLNGGDYGAVNISNITRTGLVTLQSTTGFAASMSPKINNADFIRFHSLTLRDMLIQNCSTNIQVVGNTWAQNTSGIVVLDHGFNCSATSKNILIDGNKFVSSRPAWGEGKIGLVGVNGITISNNLIQGQSAGNGGDGIQTGGSLANITVGPGNIFRDIRQGPCDSSPGVPHCDAIQFVGSCPTCTINGNWFDNVEVVLQHHDATVPVVFTNNLVTNAIQMWVYSSPGNASNSRIEHNTFYNLGLAMWGTNGSGVSDTTGLVGRNNVIIGSSAQPSACKSTGCTFINNLCSTSGQCGFNTSGTIVGAPTFVGGSPASIASWSGWQLSSGSLGYKKGSDGQDVGINYYGPGAGPGPVGGGLTPPTSLRVN
jgi:hypothetical protein